MDTIDMGAQFASDSTGATESDNTEAAYNAALAELVNKSDFERERGAKDIAARFALRVGMVREALGIMVAKAHAEAFTARQAALPPNVIEHNKAALAAALDYGTPERSAERFVEAMRADSRHLRRWRHDYYQWTVTEYEPFDDETMRRMVYEWLSEQKIISALGPAYDESGKVTLPPFIVTPKRVNDIIDAVRVKLLLPDKMETPAWIGSPGIIPVTDTEYTSFPNGLLHRPTGKLVKHNPDYFNLDARTFDYDPNARCPNWEKFLDSVFLSDHDARLALQEIMGYLQSGSNALQKLFYLQGPPRGGKGTIFNVNRALMGAANTAAPTLSSFANSFGLQPLIGKTLAIITDARLDLSRSNTAITETLLRVSGGDAIQVNRKFKDEWQGILRVRFWIGTNEAVRLNDASGALAKRWMPLLLEQNFCGREDTRLLDRLLLELPGIYNWSLVGLDRLMKRGHFVIPKSAEGLARQLAELTSHVHRFVEECCEIGGRNEPAFASGEDVIYREYRAWMEREGLNPESKVEFKRKLMAAYPAVDDPRPRLPDNSRPKMLTGIRMRRGESNKERLDAAMRGRGLRVVD